MGTKLPSTASADDFAGDNWAVGGWHQEKKAWQQDRATQGNKTADILRYTLTGGNPAAAIEPTKTQVSGLSGLDVFADDETMRWERQFGSLTEKADLVFVFYDVTSGIDIQDRIEFEDRQYRPLTINYEEQSGRVEVLTELDRSNT